MLHALKIEWLKVKNYRAFWILSILFVISIFGLNYIVWFIEDLRQEQMPETNMLLSAGMFSFPKVWHTVTYISSFLMFIPGLLMIISITNEYSYKTHRQNIIDGWSRQQFIHVKMLNALILAFMSTVVAFITAYLFGLSGKRDVSSDRVEFVGYFFLVALSYVSVATVFSLLFKRSGISIGVYFLYVAVIENLIWALMMRDFGKAAYFLPLESNDALIPNPFVDNLTTQFLQRPEKNYLLIAVAIYLIFYYWLSKRKFVKADL